MLDIPTGWQPQAKQSRAVALLAALRAAALFESSRRAENRSLLLDIPTRWEPRTKQQPAGLIACPAAQGRAVRILPVAQKESPAHKSVSGILGAMEGTRTPGLLIRRNRMAHFVHFII